MQRTKELEDCLQDYRTERTAAKMADMEKNYTKMLPALEEKIDLLINAQAALQETGEQGRIKYLYFLRLLSSGYTQSHEIALAMANERLYLDVCMDCVYWKPDIIYKGIPEDMKKAESLLNKEFIRLEKYELFHIQQRLLSDDWELLCTFLPQLVKGIADRITGSSLLMEEEMEVLCSGYMDKPETACHINTGGNVDGK